MRFDYQNQKNRHRNSLFYNISEFFKNTQIDMKDSLRVNFKNFIFY